MDGDFKRLKVLFIASDTSGPMYQVMFLPVQYFHKFNLLQARISTTLDQALAADDADIIYFQRQYLPEVIMFVRMAKQKGKILITNVDDNVWNLPLGNPARSVYTPEVLARYEAVLKEVHAVATSTPYLKKLVLPFNKDCYVERNLVEPFLNEFVSPGRDKGEEHTIRLGWHLTPHHHDDYLLVESVLEDIMNKYPQVKLIFMGYKVPIFNKFPKSRWEYYDFVQVDAFYPALASLDFDIGIAPLLDNPFNWGKTHRKFSEYAMMGVPCILSPVLPYLGLKELGLVYMPETNSREDWFNTLSYVIEHKEEREQRAINAYKWVLSNQDINMFIGEHAQIFYDVYAQVKGVERIVVWDKDIREAERVQNLVVKPGINDV